MEASRTKRVLVIGARGVLGAATARAFAAAGWVVRSGVRRPAPGQVEIDLDRPESIEAELDPQELVINAVPHPELFPERHVLERGGLLINISALPAAAGRSLRAVAAGGRGTVLMNAGLAPGVTTVVAADLLRLHPDAHELEIVLTLSSTAPRGPAGVEFLRRGLRGVARHRTALVPLPSPFGETLCLGFGERDAGWLGGIAEGRMVRQYVCLAEPAAHARLLTTDDPGAVPGSSLDLRESPGDGRAGNEPVAHWIAAIRSGRRLGARTIECRGGLRHAAISAVAFADALLTRAPQGGCFGPEEVCALDHLAPRLRHGGVRIVTHSTR